MDENFDQEELVKRPNGLTALAIFSMVSGAFGALGASFSYASAKLLLAMKTEDMDSEFQSGLDNLPFGLGEQIGEQMKDMLPYLPTLSMFNGLMWILTFMGALYMFRLKKIGFHIYIAAKIIEVFTPAFVIGSSYFNFGSLCLCALFIYAYSRFLKYMG